MAGIEKRTRNGQLSWRAHYRDPVGKQRNRSFPRHIDAERFLVTVDSSKLLGSYIDPALARLTVGDWSSRAGWPVRPTCSRPPASGTRGSCASTSCRGGVRRSSPT
jgi:hypothetical protein